MPDASTASRDAFLAARRFLFDHREDYEGAVRGFQWPTFTHFNWALDYFDPMAQNNDRPALMIAQDDGSIETSTFAALSERSSRLAAHWRAQGVKRGDRVLVMLPNVTPLWEAWLASMKLGAVIIPATTLLTAEDVASRLARGNVRHVVTDAEGAAKVSAAGAVPGLAVLVGPGEPPSGWRPYAAFEAETAPFVPDGPTPADAPLLLYFTSGTTAQPKLVMHSHQSYPVGHLSTMYWIGLKAGDRHLNIGSPGWAKHAWSNLFAPWNAEATVVATHHARFDAKKVLALLDKAQVTSLCAPPTVWRMLILEDLTKVRHTLRELVSAGEPLNPEVIDQVGRAWGLYIREGYGQTETTCQMGVTPGQTVKPGAMGRPLPGYAIALLDPDGADTTEGEVAIQLNPRPTPVMAGYADDAERTEAALGGAYYLTGDVAERDPDGYYWYVGRSDDVFKSSDYRISPFELESVLIEHPAVVEAAVVPSPDPMRMSVPKAFVSLAPGVEAHRETAFAILRYARERLAPYKRIRRLEFAELPKTISGKIRRVELRKLESQRREAGERGALEFLEEDFPELRK